MGDDTTLPSRGAFDPLRGRQQADLPGGVAGPKSAAPDSGKYRPLVEAALAVEGG